MSRRLSTAAALGAAALIAAAVPAVAAPPPAPVATAAAGGWEPLRPVHGPAMSAVLADGTVLVLSAGGARGASLRAQRLLPDGTLEPPTEVARPAGARRCVVAAVDAAAQTVAATFTCLPTGTADDPPRIAVAALLRAGDTPLAWQFADSTPASADLSPNGRHAVFTTDNQLAGTPAHVLVAGIDGTAADHPWRERGGAAGSDDVVAAVDDAGEVTVLRTTGVEDEPGAWLGGVVEVRQLDDAGRWALRRRFDRPGVGVTDAGIDLSSTGRVFATLVRHVRSDEELWALSGSDAGSARLSQVSNRTPDVHAVASAVSARGLAVAAWQLHTPRGHVATLVGTWRRGAAQPDKTTVDDGTVESPGIRAGLGVALAMAPSGRYTVAWVRHAAGADVAVVTARRGTAPGGPGRPSRWHQPVNATVQSAGVSAAGGSAMVLGRLARGELGPGAVVAQRLPGQR